MACVCYQLCQESCIEQLVILTGASLLRTDDLPSANAIYLQVNPPDARDSDNTPEVRFADESSRGRPLNQSEPGESKEEQERYPQEEQELKMCVSAKSRDTVSK